MYKKIVSILLSSVILLQGVVFAKVATSMDSSGAFSDVDYKNANFNAIQYLKDSKVVNGYEDGSFKPGNRINRAEFLKIVMEAAGKKPEGKNCYKDVKDLWYSGYVCAATDLKLVNGYKDGTFKPEQSISFVEASKIIVNTLGVDALDSNDANWYQKYVVALENRDAIPEDVATFSYEVTRGQMAEMVWRIQEKPYYVKTIGYDTLQRRTQAAASGGKLEKFDSCLDLKSYLQENSRQSHYPMMYEKSMSVPTGAVSMPAESPADDSSSSKEISSGSSDYSTTNLQVQGVDEADIVKNDGQYIYLLKGNTVRVVKAFPPTEMKELASVKFDSQEFYPGDMYVDGNRLVVIGTAYDSLWNKSYVNEKMGMMPIIADNYYYGSITKMYIFDISDKSKITQMRTLSYEGNYTSSRKIGNMVYLVMNKPEFMYVLPKGWTEHDVVPLVEDSSVGKVDVLTKCEDIMYLPGSTSTNYIVLAGVPVDKKDAKTVKEVVVGSTGNIFASTKNLYVAETKYPWFYYDYAQNQEQTTVHKFSLSSELIKYQGKADVPGHIINQFSMDEYQDNFRIATTVGHAWDTEKKSSSGIYTLDVNLKNLGKIDGIAPGEEIYSTRFAGDRAYMVTFKKVDPFFVFDMADASNPKILGKLKIPGFSDYLEPYDENHIIGFGKNATDANEEDEAMRDLDFAWYQGLKIALFDVTDVSNPKEMYKVEIGDRGTDSPVLHDHKALLFDKKKNLLAFPVTLAEISKAQKDDPKTSASTYGEIVYQGAYVYNLSLEKGFEFKGRLTHYSENEVKDKAGYYWYGDSDIKRALYIGDYLYTVSQAMVKANNLSDLVEAGSVKIGE